MDAVAATAAPTAATTAAPSATITSLESQLHELVTSTLAKTPALGSRLRNLLHLLADIPQGEVIDQETLDDFRSYVEPILRRIRVWVSKLQQRSQQRDHTAPLVGSDSTPNTIALLLFCPDGSPKSPVNATQLVRTIHSQISAFMRAETIQLPPADLNLFIQILPFALPEASSSPAHSLDTNDAPRHTPSRVRSNFLLPFHGRLVHMLQAYILNANDYIHRHPMHVYSKCFPILQSSGTGKSRLAVQLSAYQAGFVVCTRPPRPYSARDRICFPPNDDSVYDFLSPIDSDAFQHHRRIACWLGAYFAVLAYLLEKRLFASGCFDGLKRPPCAPAGYHTPPNPSESGSSAAPAAITAIPHDPDTSIPTTVTCKHSNPRLCWQTAVFHLALAIHDGPDFITNYRFPHSDKQNGLQFCPSSHLDLAACNDPDESFPEPATVSHPSSINSDKQRNQASSAGEDMPPRPPPKRPSLPLDTRRFRSYLLGKIAKIAQEEFDKPDSGPPKDEAGEAPSAERMVKHISDRYMQPHLKRLESLLPESLLDSHFFFLVIDKIMSIHAALPVLRRLWAEVAPRFTWLMFIDTDSKVAPLAGPQVRLASARLDANEQLMIIPPFSRLGFDAVIQHELETLRQPLLSGQLTFGRLLDILSCFGRPLWSTSVYRSVDHPRRPHVASILLKLLGEERWPDVWPKAEHGDLDFADPTSSFFKSVMAIAGQRLPLRFVGHQGVQLLHKGRWTPSASKLAKSAQASVQSESIKFLQDQASHHLRVISKMSDNINFFKTSTVSEPALSLSVASLLRGLTVSDSAYECVSKWSCIVKVLSHAHHAVGLMLDEEGEEGVRLLLSMAADLVASQRVEQLSQMTFSEKQDNETAIPRLVSAQCDPICVRDWLDMLFGKQNLDSKLRLWASHHYLNFTHYLRLSTYVYSDKQHRRLECNALVKYWMRQVAFYGLDKQPGWDLVIPIYRSDYTPPTNSDLFNPANLSYVAIKVKNCKSDIKATRFFGPALRSSSDGGLDSSILQNGGCDAQSLPLINYLTGDAFGLFKLFLGQVEADTPLDSGRARLDQALNAVSPHKEEFERLQSIVDGNGPACLWESHRYPTRRSTTGIPWTKKRPAEDLDDDNGVNDASNGDVAMASAQDG
ncbi:uncharacterized protein UTRI_10332 [Ustilago trichophora]|uniref:Uncharacterized protein n=1 Tax=Ustilago trichophora TaxID=86804 RepID=A0A5C3EB20_9BASI|nr:uncharacterized protein UTRI_10332 [Ustilago trichophora]